MKPFTTHVSDSSEETYHLLTLCKTLSISITVRSISLTATNTNERVNVLLHIEINQEFTDSERHGFWSRENKASAPPGFYCVRIPETKTVKPRGTDDKF